jgi:hypothetical protein
MPHRLRLLQSGGNSGLLPRIKRSKITSGARAHFSFSHIGTGKLVPFPIRIEHQRDPIAAEVACGWLVAHSSPILA